MTTLTYQSTRQHWPRQSSWHWPSQLSGHWPCQLSWHWPCQLSWHWPCQLSWHWPCQLSWHWPCQLSWHRSHQLSGTDQINHHDTDRVSHHTNTDRVSYHASPHVTVVHVPCCRLAARTLGLSVRLTGSWPSGSGPSGWQIADNGLDGQDNRRVRTQLGRREPTSHDTRAQTSDNERNGRTEAAADDESEPRTGNRMSGGTDRVSRTVG